MTEIASSVVVAQDGSPNPPHAVVESSTGFSIVMNLLGIRREDIEIRLNEKKREIAVLAKKELRYAKQGFFWIFGVPSEGALDEISTRYRRGVLEIVVPKICARKAA